MTPQDTTPSGQAATAMGRLLPGRAWGIARLLGRARTTRRLGAVLAGLALVLGGFLAAPPAQAEGEFFLVVKASAEGAVVTVSVDQCNMNSAGVTYSVADAKGAVVKAETPFTDWNRRYTFSFTWTAQKSGTYSITVKCLKYLDRVDQVNTAVVAVNVPATDGGGGTNKLPRTGD